MTSVRKSDRLARKRKSSAPEMVTGKMKPSQPEEMPTGERKIQTLRKKPASPSSETISSDYLAGQSSSGIQKRRYQQRLKEDSVQTYKKKKVQRVKASKEKWTPEKRARECEKKRIRLRKWRAKQKELGTSVSEEKREKDRLRQQRHRAQMKLKKKWEKQQMELVNQLQKDEGHCITGVQLEEQPPVVCYDRVSFTAKPKWKYQKRLKEKPVPDSCAVASSCGQKGLSPSIIRERRYRKKLKENSVRYQLHLKKEAKRVKAMREKWSPEKKAIHREKVRVWVQNWRERQRELGRKLTSPKPETRLELEEKREQNRLCQQRHGAQLKLRQQWEKEQIELVNRIQKDRGKCITGMKVEEQSPGELSSTAKPKSTYQKRLKEEPVPNSCAVASSSFNQDRHLFTEKPKRTYQKRLKEELVSDSYAFSSPSFDQARPSCSVIEEPMFQQRLQEDSVRYQLCLKKTAQRINTMKENSTPEQKARHREKVRIRVKNWREKQREYERTPNSVKPEIRSKLEKKREKDRLRQQRYRVRRKLRQQWIKEHTSMEMVDLKQRGGDCITGINVEEQIPVIKLENLASSLQSEWQVQIPVIKLENPAWCLQNETYLPFFTVQNPVSNIQSNPHEYTDSIHWPVKTVLPSTEEHVLQQSTEKNLDFSSGEVGGMYQELKKLQKYFDPKKQADVKNSKGLGIISQFRKKNGFDFNHLAKCHSQNVNHKSSFDTLFKERETEVVGFYNHGDISQGDNSQTSASAKSHQQRPKHFMGKAQKVADKTFIEDSNTKQHPKTLTSTEHTQLTSGFCEFCANIQLKQKAVNSFLSSKGLQDLHLPDTHGLLSMTLCAKKQDSGSHHKMCIDRKCKNCGVKAIRSHLRPAVMEYSDSVLTWKMWLLIQKEADEGPATDDGTDDGTETETDDRTETETDDRTETDDGTETDDRTETDDGTATGTDGRTATGTTDRTAIYDRTDNGTDDGTATDDGTDDRNGTETDDGTATGTDDRTNNGTDDRTGTDNETDDRTATGTDNGTDDRTATGTATGTDNETDDRTGSPKYSTWRMLMTSSGSLDEILSELETELETFTTHLVLAGLRF